MLKNKLRFILFCSLFTIYCSLFLSGCATAPVRETYIQPQLPGPTFTINNIQYIPLVSVCQYYNLEWDWDYIANQATLKRQDTVIKLAANSDLVLINNKPERLKGDVTFYNNNLVVPLTFATETMQQLFKVQTYLPKKEIPRTNFYTLNTIVLDPGHGGADPGAIGKRGTKEKHLCLDIAKRVKNYLDHNGLAVILTRDSDRFIPLSRRVQIAVNVKADLFVSIHANASKSRTLSGFEIYCLSDNIDDNLRAQQMAEDSTPYIFDKSSYYRITPTLKAILWDLTNTENRAQAAELSNYIEDTVREKLDIRNRRLRQARFYVLKQAKIPSILIETGYISNLSEEAKLNDQSYREELAKAIAQGILAYKERFEETDGFTR